LADLIDVYDIVVFDGRGQTGFLEEALPSRLIAGQVGFHDFQGDLSAQLGILGQIDLAHAADAQDLEDAIAREPADLVRPLWWGETVIVRRLTGRLRTSLSLGVELGK